MLTHAGFHRFENGNWAEVLVGGGYCFHRPAPPSATESAPLITGLIEAKPAEPHEPTLEAAREAVELFLETRPWVAVYTWSPRHRADGWSDQPRGDVDDAPDDPTP